MARPSDYSEELALDICYRLATGEPLVKMCKEENMPHVSTVYRWISSNEKFRDMYALAREDQADTLADEILEIADENPATAIKEIDGVEHVCLDSAAIAHQRLRVDSRKWIASKLKPRKYGDKIEHSGNQDSPLVIQVLKFSKKNNE